MIKNILGQKDILCFIKDEETHSILSAVIEKLGGQSPKIFSGGVDDAIEYFKTNIYSKIIVVDCEQEDLVVSKIETLFSVCGPDVNIIVIGDKNEISLFRDLVKINVNDYLVKPVNVDIITRTLVSIFKGDVRQKKTGKIIGFLGATGGSGCTTIATNLACVLSNELAKKVILIDTDMQFGNVSMFLDLKPSHGLREALETSDKVDDVFLEQATSSFGEHLKVFSSEEPLYDSFSYESDVFLKNFEILVDVLASKFHYLIFDISRFQPPIWRFIAKKANHLFITTNLSLTGLRDTVRILNVLNEEKSDESNHEIIINNNAEREVLRVDQFEKSLGQKATLSFPYEPSALQAANLGTPLVQHTPKFRREIQPLIDTVTGNTLFGKKPNLLDRLIHLLKK